MLVESLSSLRRIPDRTLIGRVHTLHGRSCAITAKLVAHVYEMRRRKLHVDAGYPSMFEYCTRRLFMSEGQTMRLLNAADIARICPDVLEMIRTGEVHLTGLSELKPHILPGNARSLLAMAKHRSKRSIQEEIARRFPRPMPKAEVRPMGSGRLMSMPVEREAALSGPPRAFNTSADSAPSGGDQAGSDAAQALAVLAEARTERAIHLARPPKPPSYLMPVSADVYKVSFGASRDFTEKLAWAKDLMRHRNPTGDMEVVFDAALDRLIEDMLKKKFAKTDKPRASKARNLDAKSIPAAVKRAVVARDGYRCSYVSPDGHRCGCRAFLEFEHIRPLAKGGDHSEKNVAIFCRPHNQRAADHEFGEAFMDEKRYGLKPNEYRDTSGEVREPRAVGYSKTAVDHLRPTMDESGPSLGESDRTFSRATALDLVLATVAGDGRRERNEAEIDPRGVQRPTAPGDGRFRPRDDRSRRHARDCSRRAIGASWIRAGG